MAVKLRKDYDKVNIFFMDPNPIQCAEWHHDVHVRKMAVECAQILSNCYTEDALSLAPRTQKGTIRKHSYPHHPCCKWVQQTTGNFNWLVALGSELCRLYSDYSGKKHYCKSFFDWCISVGPKQSVSCTLGDLVVPPACMPDPYKDVLEFKVSPAERQLIRCREYKIFYSAEKMYDRRGRWQGTWTNRAVPPFCEAAVEEHRKKDKVPELVQAIYN